MRLPAALRGLRAQIVLWTVLPLTLVLIGVAFTGVYSHEQAMRQLVAERDGALAVVGAARVRDLLSPRAAALGAISAEPAFRHQDRAGQRGRLAQAGNLNGLFAGDLALLSGEGSQPLAGGEAPTWARSAEALDLTRTALARQGLASVPVSDALWGEAGFLLGVAVVDDSGVPYAVLAGPVALNHLDLGEVLGGVQAGDHSAVYLIDAAGQILSSAPAGHTRASLEGHTGLPAVLAGTGAGVAQCQDPEGQRMTLAYAPVDWAGLGWRVIVEEPWHEVIGPVLRYSQFMPLVAVLAAIVSLLTLYYGVRSIVRPLQDLGQRAERVAWGDFSATSAPVGGVQEIEDLRRTLDQMARRIQNYQRGMHDYIAAITLGQEEERKRLARELHDDTAQSLIALGQQVELAQKVLVTDPARAAERLGQVRAMVAEAVEGVRRFSRDLRPIYLEDLGFLPALEMLAREAEGAGLVIHFSTDGPVRRLSPDLELAAYRIVQEALNNVLQHAGAAQAWVEVGFEPDHLILAVRDDGQGFEPPDLPDALAREGHFGLMGIQERALLYGGQMEIRAAPGQGTAVTVRLPYPPA